MGIEDAATFDATIRALAAAKGGANMLEKGLSLDEAHPSSDRFSM